MLATHQVDKHITDYAQHDAFRDAVSRRHEEDANECGDGFGIVVEVNVLYRTEHHQTDEDEHGCCCCAGNSQEEGCQEELEQEAHGCGESSKTCATANSNT